MRLIIRVGCKEIVEKTNTSQLIFLFAMFMYKTGLPDLESQNMPNGENFMPN